MFVDFLYALKHNGVPVSPTSFLRLQKALSMGLMNSLNDFYTCSRAILVKSERYFDLYDQIFAHYFEGAELPENKGVEVDDVYRALLEEWLKNPKIPADILGVDESEISKLSPEELIEYFKKRLEDQDGAHHGGNKWIGTGGTSPVGHSGYHPGGMRVGGVSRNKSAVKVAMDRRYKDYSLKGPLKESMIGEALKRLRHMKPSGPMDKVNVDKTIYRTLKNAGEIEIVFDRSLKDKLKVFLIIDNGGWSMDPYIQTVQVLFDYARSEFKDLKTFFFHNTIYDVVWEDPGRSKKPVKLETLAAGDTDTRLIFVGDASMAPYELHAADGSINISERSGKPSIERMKYLAESFKKCVWMNPTPIRMWGYTHTINIISKIFPMYELTLDGLEEAIDYMTAK